MIAVVALVIAIANAAWVAGWSWWLYRRLNPKPMQHDTWPPEGFRGYAERLP